MPRQIEFRGFNRCTKTWSYAELKYIVEEQVYNPIEYFKVDPDTIGEYFGWCDASGKKIFTGDIVKIDSSLIGEVGFDQEQLEYIIKVHGKLIPFGPFIHCNIEIIGNIYDNHELVEKEED